MKNTFVVNFVLGLILGMVLVFMGYAFYVGMGREIHRQEVVREENCELYGFCE